MMESIKKVLRDQIDLLLLRPFVPDLRNHGSLYLIWGLAVTWLAGIGRYWDHPDAMTWQYLGLGSVAYVFVLAAILWLIALPLGPRHWSYQNVLLFVAMTSPPALLYAIPVERWVSLETAQSLNLTFLLVVALWRVVLLLKFLGSVAGLGKLAVAVVGLLPLALIVTALVALNLEHAVFEIMGGLRNQTSHDSAYGALIVISVLAVIASPVLLIGYIVLILKSRRTPAGVAEP